MNRTRHPHPALHPVIAVLMSLVAAVGVLEDIAGARFSFTPTGPILENDRRFDAIRRALPAHGEIGYVSDLDQAGTAGLVARCLAQYSLVPLLLDPPVPFPRAMLDPAIRADYPEPHATTARPEWVAGEWVIGDFHDPVNAPAIANREGLAIVRDFGSGVILLRRVTQ